MSTQIKLEYRCRSCGRIAGVEETAISPEPRCCGMAMRAFSVHGDKTKPGTQVNLVEWRGVQYRMWWVETWEARVPRTVDVSASMTDERIGWCGKLVDGTWEWEMVPGITPHDGVAFDRSLAIEQMVDAYSGGLGVGW